MLILQTPDKYRILIGSHGEHDGSKQEHLARLKAECVNEDENRPPYQASISDCDQVGPPRASYSSICNCPNECHGGWAVNINEVILVSEKIYTKLQDIIMTHEGKSPGLPLSDLILLGY